MTKRSKKTAQRRHFDRRLLQRSNIEDIEGFKLEALKQIQGGYSKFVERQSNRVGVHCVLYKEEEIFVVYDSNTKNLVTVLERGWILGSERAW